MQSETNEMNHAVLIATAIKSAVVITELISRFPANGTQCHILKEKVNGLLIQLRSIGTFNSETPGADQMSLTIAALVQMLNFMDFFLRSACYLLVGGIEDGLDATVFTYIKKVDESVNKIKHCLDTLNLNQRETAQISYGDLTMATEIESIPSAQPYTTVYFCGFFSARLHFVNVFSSSSCIAEIPVCFGESAFDGTKRRARRREGGSSAVGADAQDRLRGRPSSGRRLPEPPGTAGSLSHADGDRGGPRLLVRVAAGG